MGTGARGDRQLVESRGYAWCPPAGLSPGFLRPGSGEATPGCISSRKLILPASRGRPAYAGTLLSPRATRDQTNLLRGLSQGDTPIRGECRKAYRPPDTCHPVRLISVDLDAPVRQRHADMGRAGGTAGGAIESQTHSAARRTRGSKGNATAARRRQSGPKKRHAFPWSRKPATAGQSSSALILMPVSCYIPPKLARNYRLRRRSRKKSRLGSSVFRITCDGVVQVQGARPAASPSQAHQAAGSRRPAARPRSGDRPSR